jgi:putative inorganic carbon (HCO3(-)) transporter
MSVRAINGRLAGPLLSAALITLTGLAVFALAQQATDMRPKMLIVGAGAAALIAAAVASGAPRALFLFGWTCALTYNRQYFSFDSLFGGDSGSAGLYWIASDGLLVLLIGYWLYELAILKRPLKPLGRRVWPFYLPFCAACVASAFMASRPDWTLFDLVRVAKVAIVLVYARYNIGRTEWWACIVGFGTGMVLQSSLGVLEVVSGKSGALWLFGLQDQMADVPGQYRLVEYYGWMRATATMAHPPNLACFLLITIPIFAALALAARLVAVRWASAAAAGIGAIGLACTLSRFPWLVAVCEMAALAVGLTVLGLVPLKRIAGLAVVLIFVGLGAALPFSDLIADRMSRDFDRSVDFRASENEVALRMVGDHPLLGVGLNNYRDHLVEYGSEMADSLKDEDVATQQLKVRYIAGPLNAYLLVFAETGAIGLAAFLFYLAGVYRMGFRAVAACAGEYRAVSLALVVGLIGVMLQQVIDYSYWVDPILYAFTLQAGLLNVAPALWGAA